MANNISHTDRPASDRSDSPIPDKSTAAQVEYARASENHVFFDEKATQRLLRKMDVRLIPFLALLYLLSFLDRTNIGNARLAGLEADIGLQGLQYNHALAVFFPFYVLVEVPSNIMIKRTRPALWIPFIMVCWGVCTTLMGLVQNFPGLMAARAALGIAEGGLFPGVTWYITMWYRRHECGFRMAVFFSAATIAGAFGGLLARGIAEMDGVGGLNGWSWIFILEGLLTLIVAGLAFIFMHDYPATAKFLTAEEKEEVARRLTQDRSSLADEYNIKYVFDALKDWKIWVHMFITIGIYTPLYSVSLFMPTIVRGLGYTNETAQLMTVPPYVVACLFCITAGYIADRLQTRGLFMLGFTLIAIAGFIMQLASTNNTVKYVGIYFVTCGVYPNVPQGIAWNANNMGGSTKRGVGVAMHVAFGNLGGIAAAYIYRAREAPRFTSGHASLIGFLSMSLLLQILMTLYLRRENKRRDAASGGKLIDEYTEAEKSAERERGDLASFFRYTV